MPNISQWNTKNVTKMNNAFNNCSSLLSLPDLSKWNLNKVIDLGDIFFNCSLISSLPDLSTFDIRKNIQIFFSNYKSSVKNSITQNLFYLICYYIGLPTLNTIIIYKRTNKNTVNNVNQMNN